MQITFSKIKLNFIQFVNRDVKILGRRLYSPSLADVALLGDAFIYTVNFPNIHILILDYDWQRNNRK